MGKKSIFLVLGIVLILSVMAVSACKSSSPTPTPGPGGGAVINSDSIITGEIKAISPQTTGYPWEVDVVVQSSENIGSLPNPTSDKVGQVATAKTDQDMKSFTIGQAITARVKYVGDVPKPGISLYIYDIAAK